VFMKE